MDEDELELNEETLREIKRAREDIKKLQASIKKLQPRTSSFYLGLSFIIFIIIISYLSLSFYFALGVTLVSIIPLMMCVYAILKLRK